MIYAGRFCLTELVLLAGLDPVPRRAMMRGKTFSFGLVRDAMAIGL
jgi:hypothetical protein